MLDNEQYNSIRNRLKEKGFRCGFTCLFYGAPGTGKTETVLQLARQTGRDILQVDISQIKSMWVGESEKNIKQVFERYKAKVKESKITVVARSPKPLVLVRIQALLPYASLLQLAEGNGSNPL